MFKPLQCERMQPLTRAQIEYNALPERMQIAFDAWGEVSGMTDYTPRSIEDWCVWQDTKEDAFLAALDTTADIGGEG